jgi:hypothetical protein
MHWNLSCPYDKKHKAVRMASRIFATILMPVGQEGWEKARKRAEKVLTELADHTCWKKKRTHQHKSEERRKRSFDNFANTTRKIKKPLDLPKHMEYNIFCNVSMDRYK